MALWGLWGTNAAWNIEAALKSVALPVWQTVSSVDNLKAAGSAAIGAIVENPLTTAATVAVGAVTYVVYRNKGFGIGLGQFNASFDNFLANAKVQIGLGRKKPSEVQDLDARMATMEAGLRDLRTTEERRHRETTEAIQGVSQQITDKFATVLRTLTGSNPQPGSSDLLTAIRVGNNGLAIQMGEVKKGLQEVAGESAGMKAQLVRMAPAAGK